MQAEKIFILFSFSFPQRDNRETLGESLLFKERFLHTIPASFKRKAKTQG